MRFDYNDPLRNASSYDSLVPEHFSGDRFHELLSRAKRGICILRELQIPRFARDDKV